MNDEKALSDFFRYNPSSVDAVYERTAKSYHYLLERRDRHMDRIRFGALTLNLGSVLGVLSVLGAKSGGELARYLSPPEQVLLPFLLGTVCAAVAVLLANRRFYQDASDGADLLRQTQKIRARLADIPNERNVEKLGEDITAHQNAKVPDFSYSGAEFAFINISGSLWVTGLAVPIYHMVRAIEWNWAL